MNQITCPNCAHAFDVEQALSGRLEAQFQAEYERKVAQQAAKFNAERDKMAAERGMLEAAQAAFEAKKARENELFKERLEKSVAQQVAEKVAAKEAEISKRTHDDFSQKLESLQAENARRQAENKELKAKEVALWQRERDLKEQAEELDLRVQKQLLEQQQAIEEKARAKEREANALKEKEYQKQLDDQRKLIDEMKRKAEQGSMQMQGEVQELALEALLRQRYPFDEVSEVAKGVRGADCVQTVINERQKPCGSIVYESKRTKNFGGDWIDKLKQDQVNCKADIAVLVTATMPADMPQFGLRDGVWVCSFNEVAGLSMVLRQQLLRVQSVRSAEENKGDKMELLYRFFTSNEFAQNVKRVLENHETMVLQLNRERRAMEKLWKEREKQIWTVQENVASLFGSIKGIAGKELEDAGVLELPLDGDADSTK